MMIAINCDGENFDSSLRLSSRLKISRPRPGDLKVIQDRVDALNKWAPESRKLSSDLLSTVISKGSSVVIADNLLVGLYFPWVGATFIDPWAFSCAHLNIADLESLGVLGSVRDLETERYGSLSAERCLVEQFDIDPTRTRRRPVAQSGVNRVLILGPAERSMLIRDSLVKKGCEVETCEVPPAVLSEMSIASRFNLVLSNGYAYKLPAFLVADLKGRLFNIHPTYLPWGRGVGTILYDALLGHPPGFSIHFIDEEIDRGDVVYRRRLHPSAEETTRTYHRRAVAEVSRFTVGVLDTLLTSEVTGTPQAALSSEAIPYTSRHQFELLMRDLPDGYDTRLAVLSVYGRILCHNKNSLLLASQASVVPESVAQATRF